MTGHFPRSQQSTPDATPERLRQHESTFSSPEATRPDDTDVVVYDNDVYRREQQAKSHERLLRMQQAREEARQKVVPVSSPSESGLVAMPWTSTGSDSSRSMTVSPLLRHTDAVLRRSPSSSMNSLPDRRDMDNILESSLTSLMDEDVIFHGVG